MATRTLLNRRHDPRPARPPGVPCRRRWAWLLTVAVLASGGCGAVAPESSSSPSSRVRWTYDEVIAHTTARIREVTWPPGLEPTAAELIGRREDGPPVYDSGFDASRVAYDRMCAWWVAWHRSRYRGAAAEPLLAGLDAAVADFAASDNPGAPTDRQRRAVEAARRGDPAGLDGDAFTRSCLIGAGRWWDARSTTARSG